MEGVIGKKRFGTLTELRRLWNQQLGNPEGMRAEGIGNVDSRMGGRRGSAGSRGS